MGSIVAKEREKEKQSLQPKLETKTKESTIKEINVKPNTEEKHSETSAEKKISADSKNEFEQKWSNTTDHKGSLSDFELIKSLVPGTFGKMTLVKYKGSGNNASSQKYFTMKTYEKHQLEALGQNEHVANEIRLLQSIDHSFIVKMFYWFEDITKTTSIYLVFEFVPGCDMFDNLRNQGKFEESLARFYASQIVLAFEYLHFLDVIYRNLKPENVLIAPTGYLKLTDFSFAKRVTDRTWTLCGTPDYLPPEIITGMGHNKGVDWWTLGIFIYEMMAGYTPFIDEDPMQLYKLILKGNVTYPAYFSQTIVDLLVNLLRQNPTQRYGNAKNGIDDVKNHLWFANTKWDDVYERKLIAPFIPHVTDPGANSNLEIPGSIQSEFEENVIL